MKCPKCSKNISFWDWFKNEYKCETCKKKEKEVFAKNFRKSLEQYERENPSKPFDWKYFGIDLLIGISSFIAVIVAITIVTALGLNYGYGIFYVTDIFLYGTLVFLCYKRRYAGIIFAVLNLGIILIIIAVGLTAAEHKKKEHKKT